MNSNVVTKFRAVLAMVVLLAALLATDSRAFQGAPEGGLVSINPPRSEVFAGGIGATAVQVESQAALAEVSLRLLFDPAIIHVLDADLEREGVQVGLNPALLDGGATATQNRVDNAAGVIELNLTGLNAPGSPFDVAIITWFGRQEGTAELQLSEVTLTPVDAPPLTPDTQSSTIEVTAAPGDPIIGRVLLEGRRDFSDTAVYASIDRCPAAAPGLPIRPVGDLLARTDGGGFFEVVPRNGEVYRCVQVVRRGYLQGQRDLPEGDIGTVTLLGGDVTQDNVVNIFDLAGIGSRYGDNDPNIDINGDGVVSIFDLVQAAANYGKRGPITIWR
ncbi:MAG: hypothetical protein Kow0031_21170 [Anaerolineae bacterium]